MVNSLTDLACGKCARTPHPNEDPYQDWRNGSDGHEELTVFCPECFRQKFLYSSMVEVRTPGELVESYVWGGPSRYLMSAYYRTDKASAVLRNGFHDRDYVLPGIGTKRGALVSWPWPAFGDSDPPDQGGEALQLEIPEHLFLSHKLPDLVGDEPGDEVINYTLYGGGFTLGLYARAVIPASSLNEVTLSSVDEDSVRPSAGESRFPHVAMDRAWIEDYRDRLRTYEQSRRERIASRWHARVPDVLVLQDLDILFGAGDFALARRAVHDAAAMVLVAFDEGPTGSSDLPVTYSVVDHLAAQGDHDAAVNLLDRYLAARDANLRPKEGNKSEADIRSDIEELRRRTYELPEVHQIRLPPPDELRVPDGALFDALPQSACGNVRFVFIGGPIHYFDPRGEFECESGTAHEEVQSAWPPLAEECARVMAMVTSREWTRAAVLLAHRLLQAAQRVGNTSAWTYSIGIARHGLPGDVKALTGRFPTRAKLWGPESVGLDKPARGRWLFDHCEGEPKGRPDHRPALFAIHCLRDQTVIRVKSTPSVALWRWPDRSDMMLQAFCDTLSPLGSEPATVVLPDTPSLRDFAYRYVTRQRMTRTDRALIENLGHFAGSGWASLAQVVYVRPRPTLVVEPDGREWEGDLLVAALDFLDANYQVRIAPWDIGRDSILLDELASRADALHESRLIAAQWTREELGALERVRLAASLATPPAEQWLRRFSPHRPRPLGPS